MLKKLLTSIRVKSYLKTYTKKGHIKENSLQEIYKDPCFKHLNKLKEESRKALPYDPLRCDAREWSVENKNNTDYVVDNLQCLKTKEK